MSRPRALILVSGTATEIGKTWVGAAVLAELAGTGVAVAARKPAQSFDPDDGHPTDAQVLAAATGEHPDVVCPPGRSYPVPMAPPMAAAVLGWPVPTMADLLDELTWPDLAPDLGWVETVGGPRSPVADDGDAVTLADHLGPDLVVVVADAGLGTVNAVLVSVAPFAPRQVVVMLNRYDDNNDLHRRNRRWLTERNQLPVVTSVSDLVAHLTTSLGLHP